MTPDRLIALPQDSVVVESPLPGGVAAVVRFLLQTVPQWVQIGGLFVGMIVAAAVAVLAWRRRRSIISWLVTRSRNVKIAVASAAGTAVLAAAAFGAVSWNYTQHDNDFCTGCHVMTPAFVRFTESEHNTLSCHDCHQQSVFASMRQLYLWVAERPGEIGPHAPVANRVCENCHVTGEPEVWQRIASTAGHRTHLESDSSALREVMCVTCHGQDVHRFAPVDQTCAQADCHVSTKIVLGTMEDQTALHCVGCHQFTALVPVLATWDSAAATLVPGMRECFSCHEMQAVLADFDPAFDPHKGSCGMCHNPHEQEVVTDANQTCASANCHVGWRAVPFHVGTRHLDVGRQCTWCHEPHRARIDASDCTGCHAAVAGRPDVPRLIRDRLRRVAPFDTSQAIPRGTTSLVPTEVQRHRNGSAGSQWEGDQLPRTEDVGPPVELWSHRIASFPPIPPDTFTHAKHSSLSCLNCHETRTGHGRLTFEPPRGCQICHHRAPSASDCAECHTPTELAAPLAATARFTVADHQARTREIEFAHQTHADLRCTDCHTEPVSLAPRADAANCTACHEDHHAAARACAECHGGAAVQGDHAPPVDAHVGCDACHDAATISRLLPDRSFCATCHQPQAREHYPDRECTVCHLQATPEAFRPRLSRQGGK